MRLLNSLKNSAMSVGQMLVTTLFTFLVRTVFIRTLGVDYQGLNSLFTSIIGMLSIAELGIGTAIIFNMYQPLAAGDTETLKSLMRFYRNCYRVVALVVTAIGLLLLPFLHLFSHYPGIHDNVILVFLLFLASTVAGYLFSYKRSILYADQKNYWLSLFDTLQTLILDILQLVILLQTHSFILFLLASLVTTLLENFYIAYFANKRYPWLREKPISPLPRDILHAFRKQIYGMFFHNIGTFVVFGTDSLIITAFLGLGTMGRYANYLLVTNAASTLLGTLISGVTASVGDLLTENDPDAAFDIYQKMSFLNFWLESWAAIAIFLVMQPFITLWLGKSFLLSISVLFCIVLNFYVTGMRRPIQIFQSAAGIFYENRHVPILESLINLVASLILVHFLGLEGVLIGTLLSTMILYGYSFPKYLYQPTFKRPNRDYVIEQLRWLVLFLAMLALSALIFFLGHGISGHWALFAFAIALGLIFPNLLLILLFSRRSEFHYYKGLLLSAIRRTQ